MKMILTIVNIDGSITWRLSGRGLNVTRSSTYKLVKNAVKGGKYAAARLGIEITSCLYREPKDGYKCFLDVL